MGHPLSPTADRDVLKAECAKRSFDPRYNDVPRPHEVAPIGLERRGIVRAGNLRYFFGSRLYWRQPHRRFRARCEGDEAGLARPEAQSLLV